ncbi:MAG: glycerol kinase GlpK [Eubacteriales bacterium]|nr:glycerol kinase GlpK [Eubacteriales bacterium]
MIMRPTFLITLDQGTTSCRALIFNDAGQLVTSKQAPIKQFYPQPGWVEEDPNEILKTQVQVLQAAYSELIASQQVVPSQIAGIGITNQRETVVLWDKKTGQPVHPAIVWQCRRTTKLIDRLRAEGYAEWIHERTGLVLDAYFSATKLMWLFENDPDLLVRAQAGELLAGTIDSWLIWHLTGGRTHVTDASNASRTMLFNIKTGQWDNELLRLFGIPSQILPQVVRSAGTYGTLDESILPGHLPLAGLAGDQQAALFGQACFLPGMTKNTYGTGCFILMQTGQQPIFSKNGLLTTVAWDIGHGLNYALEGSVFNAGSTIQWLRDELKIIRQASDCDTLAASVSDSAGVQIVPAFTGLGAPYWDMNARGLISGITRGTTSAHIARAVLESIAMQSQDVLHLMHQETGIPISDLKVDGGAAVSDLLMQMQADFSQVPVDRPQITETTAFGAAALAGIGLSVWPDLTQITQVRASDRIFQPHPIDARYEARLIAWQKAIAAARAIGCS